MNTLLSVDIKTVSNEHLNRRPMVRACADWRPLSWFVFGFWPAEIAYPDVSFQRDKLDFGMISRQTAFLRRFVKRLVNRPHPALSAGNGQLSRPFKYARGENAALPLHSTGVTSKIIIR